jgi:arabinofuranan 3-O-arabinosyltransferase
LRSVWRTDGRRPARLRFRTTCRRLNVGDEVEEGFCPCANDETGDDQVDPTMGAVPPRAVQGHGLQNWGCRQAGPDGHKTRPGESSMEIGTGSRGRRGATPNLQSEVFLKGGHLCSDVTLMSVGQARPPGADRTGSVDLAQGRGRSARDSRWLALSLWLLVLVVGVVDIHHVVVDPVAWWGLDYRHTINSVVDLVHHRALDPLFVYPPGLLILEMPLLIIKHGRRDFVLLIEVAGMIVTLWALAKVLLPRRLADPGMAFIALAMVLSAQFVFALQLENLTLLLLPAAALFFLAIDRDRWLWAGVILGLSFTVKPMLVPLIVILILQRKWKATAISLAIPTVLSGIALLFVADPGSVIRNTISWTVGSKAGGESNSANLVEVAKMLNLGSTAATAARIVVVLAALVIARQLWMSSLRPISKYIWTSQVLLAGLFLSSTETHVFYPLLLLPLAVLALSESQSPSSWIAAAGLLLAWWPIQVPGIFWSPTTGLDKGLICLGMLIVVAAGGVAALGSKTVRSDSTIRPDRISSGVPG